MRNSSYALSSLLFIILASCTYINLPRDENKGRGEPLPQARESTVSITPFLQQEEEIPDESEIPPVGLYAPIPYCEAKITLTTGVLSDEVTKWKEFVVQVCELPLDFSRVPFGVMIQSQRLAHGALWTNLYENDNWYVIEYRMPQTEKDFKKLNEEGEIVFRRTLYVLQKGLPLLIRELPGNIQEEILGFMVYPHGGFEIFLLNNNEVTAQKVLRAVQKILNRQN